MKINKRLNTLTYQEYSSLLSQHQKYTDFNTLGLFRSITENEKLDPTQKIDIRDQAVATFQKTFEFLQLKDPGTYFKLTTLGQQLTVADEAQRWDDIRLAQQNILKDKQLRHRNFGTYSKHLCPYDTCPFNGLMVRQGSRLGYGGEIHLCSDKNSYARQVKSERRRQERRTGKQIIAGRIDSE